MVAATAVADFAAQALQNVGNAVDLSGKAPQPPDPLPAGWLLKESRSQPGFFYYYHQETGESTWSSPVVVAPPRYDQQPEDENQLPSDPSRVEDSLSSNLKLEDLGLAGSSSTLTSSKRSTQSRGRVKEEPPEKKHKISSSSRAPKEVRVLHILKKHKDSRRPSSWRSNNKPITITRNEAREELEGLLEILNEEKDNPENLIATFKELASQESDCSSAKRHGDLGFFGRKKMRPEFEEAAFGLEVNELSKIVETASGAHILLRLE